MDLLYIKGVECVDRLGDCRLLKKNSALWGSLDRPLVTWQIVIHFLSVAKSHRGGEILSFVFYKNVLNI